MIMRTFVEAVDLSGRTVHPVVTHAVSGIGQAEGDYRELLPGADLGRASSSRARRSAPQSRRSARGCAAPVSPTDDEGGNPSPPKISPSLGRTPRTSVETMSIPTITLNNGVTMPALGLGVFQTPPDETIAAVEAALEVGYRHVDTAAAYGNEREVGEAIRRSGLARDEVFVETKIWISDYGYDETLHSFDKSAGKLGVEQIDLLILHQALPGEFDTTIGAYRALERLLADGRVRAIGVSNFMHEHLDRLLAETEVVPAVNQIEVHPYFRQSALLDRNNELGIVSQAWSPIGGITFYRDSGHTSTLENETIRSIADAHGKTPAQVMLGWHLQQGRQVIPKSVTPARIAENFDVFDIELSETELAAIDGLDTGKRGGPEPEDITLESFGREIPEA